MKSIDLSQIPVTHPVVIMSRFYDKLPRTLCPFAPLWSEFDPMAVPSVLQWTAVIARQDDTLEGHRYRLVGEGVKTLMGADYTGQNLADVLSVRHQTSQWSDFVRVADSRQPSFHTSTVPIDGREFISVYRGCFPFCNEVKFINRLVLVVAQASDLIVSEKQRGTVVKRP